MTHRKKSTINIVVRKNARFEDAADREAGGDNAPAVGDDRVRIVETEPVVMAEGEVTIVVVGSETGAKRRDATFRIQRPG